MVHFGSASVSPNAQQTLLGRSLMAVRKEKEAPLEQERGGQVYSALTLRFQKVGRAAVPQNLAF
jgi:hypothetical protein